MKDVGINGKTKDQAKNMQRAKNRLGMVRATGMCHLPCGSWFLGCSLKFFHHDLRSRFVGGEAALGTGAEGGEAGDSGW